MLATLTNNTVLLGKLTRVIVRRAQAYMNYLTRFQFWATRALEIYAHRDYSDSLTYDIGYLTPDHEENAYLALARGDGSRVLPLLDAYLTSYSKLPGIIVLRDEYEAYRQGLVTQQEYWIFTDVSSPDANKLAKFRQTGSLEFQIGLDDLMPDRFECKMDGVAVALSGATSTDPLINCVLMHEGTSSVKVLGGGMKSYAYPPRGCPLLAEKSEADIGNVPPTGPESFWGRSPASKWRLYLEVAPLYCGVSDDEYERES
jgi:hypothetical protein